MGILLSGGFWVVLFILGIGALIALVMTKRTELLNNTVVAVTLSMVIALSYFHIVNHYLMEMQGLDYWYLFRE